MAAIQCFKQVCCTGRSRMTPAAFQKFSLSAQPAVLTSSAEQATRSGLVSSASRAPYSQQPPCCVRSHVTRHTILAASADVVKLDIDVDGMMCDGCSSRIEQVLKGMDKVQAVAVSLEGKKATVEVSQSDAADMLPQLVNTIKELGFEAQPAK